MDRYYKYIDAVSLSASRINDINIFLREPDKSRMMFRIFGMTRGDKDARKIAKVPSMCAGWKWGHSANN